VKTEIAVAILVAATSAGTLIITRAFDAIAALLKRSQAKQDQADAKRDRCRDAVEAVLQCAQQWQATSRFAIITKRTQDKTNDYSIKSGIEKRAQAYFADATESFRCYQDSLNTTLAQTDEVDLHPTLRKLIKLSTEIHSEYVR